jgi:hypothetical protein
MPKLQNFPVTRNNDETLGVFVDSDIPSDSLLHSTVHWSVWGMAYGVPMIDMPPLIVKDSTSGGITVLDSPPMNFDINLSASDTEPLDLGNYYHEGWLVDSGGGRVTVVYGALAVTLSVG